MKVARLIIYEGDCESLSKQLGQSLNDGEKQGYGNCVIKVFTLGTMPEYIDIKTQEVKSENPN